VHFPPLLRQALSIFPDRVVVGNPVRRCGSDPPGPGFERNSKKATVKALLWVTSVTLLAAGTGLAIWSTITEVKR
jgi:hypothetical protein